jgi:5'-phosphate synthase pdxT subunit
VKKIGVLALQGDFEKHHQLLAELGLESISVRTQDCLERVEGLVIPGGESTTLSILMESDNFVSSIQSFGKTYPILGTCAGLIMMAKSVLDQRINPLGLLDIQVNRNAYGRQIQSSTELIQMHWKDTIHAIPATMIRAPKIEKVGDDVKILAEWNGAPVAVMEGHHIGINFHPELNKVSLFHEILFQPKSQNFHKAIQEKNVS